ncbi:lytic transglycosylase domain-containing protein [Calditerrivibrio nitroreducens]|uniref:Lytic transglycosylase catalytic n=1 Tax=Calditerrivibrio nitroreducens (strain DSM 19672 / NBRC 101217 / Yu37-1) TaxID=768670 RepID=E4TJS4_CALNY|nr:lytic transglycosylase domain-containing protein [Calditerrivibrio nitroreducens]ADR19270.1 Lytic transglycosylase catalytic [Calditerrivibrio nitroreducens DSM 19672]
MKTFFCLLLSFISSVAYPYCFDEAEKIYNVNKELLIAIAKVESNMRPDAINWNRNGTFDYGVMQINSAWYYELGEEKWHKLADPCENVKTGAMILSKCIKKYGFNWKAVDCYNKGSKASDFSSYVLKVYKQLVSSSKNKKVMDQ